MSGVLGIIIIGRIIWWVIRSQSARPQVRMEPAQPEESRLPARPQLGGYGLAAPEEPDAQ
jgi:hypothetical protein